MTDQVLVAGIGNVFLGDDGFGPEVARCLTQQRLPEGVRVVDYGIRGMHLAYDLLDGYERLVLIDTVPDVGTAGDVALIEVGPEDLRALDGPAELDAHGMQPTAVLASLEALGGSLPPTVLVGCQPADLSDGMELSAPVAAAVEVAVSAVLRLLATSELPTTSSRPAALIEEARS